MTNPQKHKAQGRRRLLLAVLVVAAAWLLGACSCFERERVQRDQLWLAPHLRAETVSLSSINGGLAPVLAD